MVLLARGGANDQPGLEHHRRRIQAIARGGSDERKFHASEDVTRDTRNVLALALRFARVCALSLRITSIFYLLDFGLVE